MTAQMTDTIIYKGCEYELIGIKGGQLATPKQFGMESEEMSTACYRGFYATYEIFGDVLYLREITINAKNGQYIPIAGINPKNGDYKGLNIRIFLSGEIRLATNFIPELYVHMGYQKPSSYNTVIDVKLKNGKVIGEKDRSEEVEQKRGAFKEKYDKTLFSFDISNIVGNIDDAFSLNMDSQELSSEEVLNVACENKILDQFAEMIEEGREEIIEMLLAEIPISKEKMVRKVDSEMRQIEEILQNQDQIGKRFLQILLMVYRNVSYQYLANIDDAFCEEKEGQIEDQEETKSEDSEYDATDFLSRRIEKNPKLTTVYYDRATEYFKKGEFEKAVVDFTRAIELEQEDKYTDEHCLRNYFLGRGVVYLEIAEYDKSIADFTSTLTLKIHPDLLYLNADAYHYRAVAYFNKGQYKRAIEDSTRAIELNAELARAYNVRCCAYTMKGEYDKAIVDSTNAIKRYPNLDYAYRNRGNAYIGKGECEKAIEDYSKAIEINPRSPFVYHERHKAYILKGENNKAATDLQRFLRLSTEGEHFYSMRVD